uniref:GNAT family N-acetyltransferase n=1 Tax=Thaumasiovibrio occultus TaxID=1891184 RepID=UPI00131C67EC|nr:GNAT family N-acetyltransferase [Thaumasiovibrio occultus]
MHIQRFTPQQLIMQQDALNALLSRAFNAPVTFALNSELAAGVIVRNQSDIIGCGFMYQRTMLQGENRFLAAIIGGIAVHPNYQGQGVSKAIMAAIDALAVEQGADHAFLFAYQPEIYHAAGYRPLNTPIYFYDTPKQCWAEFIYRGGMIKPLTDAELAASPRIEFNGCVY